MFEMWHIFIKIDRPIYTVFTTAKSALSICVSNVDHLIKKEAKLVLMERVMMCGSGDYL